MDDWNEATNVLCIRLDALGDVLMTTPALKALKNAVHGRKLTLLGSQAATPLVPLLPTVDEFITYQAPWMKAAASHSARHDRELIADLASRQFDAAVIFTVYSQNPLPAAHLCYLAEIPYRLAHCRENPYQLLTHWVPDPEPQRFVRHEVQRQLDLVAVTGARLDDERLGIQLSPDAVSQMQQRLEQLSLDLGRPWAVLHVGASAPSRRYPPESFAAVARTLALENGWQLVFTGSIAEQELIDEVRRGADVATLSLAGRTNLEELAALLALAPVLISNNSGPVHLAAAVGTPVVDLYALTNPQHAPWHVAHELLFHDVPCKNCYKSVCPEKHHNCLRLVPPAAVVAAARRLAQAPAATRRWDAAASADLVTPATDQHSDAALLI